MAGFRKAYHANCWGPLGGNAVGVTSITQLTYRTFGDMERAVREIAEAGYAGIELFDGNLLDYERRTVDFRRMLNDAGICLVAGYSGANFIFGDVLGEELARIERAAGVAADLGAEHLVVGGGAKRAHGREADDFKRLAAGLDTVIRIAERSGLTAHYHPHLSTIVEGPEDVREIFRHTAIHFCPDTAHLAAAGGDPARQIAEFRDRVTYVHLKGLRKEPFGFTPLDRGDLAIGPIIDALGGTAFPGWITTELDAWPDAKEGAMLSMEFLRAAERRV